MATTQDFGVTKDTRIARRESDNWDAGSGTSPGLPYGLYSGYRYRALLGFSINFAGWTSITQALFYYKTSDQISVAFGSDPTMLIQRLSAAWSEGTQSGLSASNATIFPGPGAYSTNQVEEDAPTAENTWGYADITAMMRDAMAAGVFHGIRILGSTNTPGESDSSANVGEIYSREGGSDAYIRITYETNRAPNAPTVDSSSVSGGLSGTVTPTLNVTATDPDANNIAQLNWQLATDSGFASVVASGTPAGPWANGSVVPIVMPALTRGTTYYFRVQAADASVWGAWSTTFQLKIASVPVLTLSEPSASGRLARLTYDAGSGWGSPRMVLNWVMTCPDGGTQASWRVEVYGDSAGAPSGMIEDITVNDTQSSRVVPYNLVEGNYYNVRVWATCSHGLTQAVGFYRVRARWGVAVYGADMGATPIGSLTLTTLDVTDETTGGQGRVVVEYQTTPANAPPSVWASTIGGAGLNRYFWYAVYLLTWGASPTVSPTLNALTITYTTSTIVPDRWAFTDAAYASGDVSSYVYGTKSLRLKGKGAAHWAYQQVTVAPNTRYILSGRIQSNAAGTGAFIDVATMGGAELVYTPEQWLATDFEEPASRVATPSFDSGNNTTLQVRCLMQGPVGTTAWFDALKLEASTVVTPWQPGYVANAVVLDAGGLQIDASQGGVFRLRGSAGGARDIVELGPNGLRFAGDGNAELYSPGADQLRTWGHFLTGGFIAAGTAISAGQAIDAQGAISGAYNLARADRAGILHIGGVGDSGFKWAKIMSGSMAGQYWSLMVQGRLATRYGHTDLSVNINTDPGPASQPFIVGTMRVAAEYAGLAIKTAVVVVRSLNPVVWELYVQVPGGYQYIDWYPETMSWDGGSAPVVENPGVTSWVAALPAGNQTALIIHNGVRMQRGSTSRNITAANGTAQGVVTFPVPFQNTPFVWAYANASAGNAAYVTIQSVSTTSFDLGLKAATVWNYGVEWFAISL